MCYFCNACDVAQWGRKGKLGEILALGVIEYVTVICWLSRDLCLKEIAYKIAALMVLAMLVSS